MRTQGTAASHDHGIHVLPGLWAGSVKGAPMVPICMVIPVMDTAPSPSSPFLFLQCPFP